MSDYKSALKKLNTSFVIVIIVLAACLTGVNMTDVVAKYYIDDISRETIVANTFYFSSDYLDVPDENGNPPEYSVNGWDGMTDKSFAFVIRNYENPLLFNDSAQDLDYEISYSTSAEDSALIDVSLWKYEPDNVNAVNGYIQITSGSRMTIKGDNSHYNHDDYKIMISSKNPSVPIERDVKVSVTAQSINVNYQKTITTNIILRYTEYAAYIAQKGFVSTDQKLAALDYAICTANEQSGDSLLNSYSKLATKTLLVTWNNDYLEFDRFDERKENESDIIYIDETVIDGNVCTLTYVQDNAKNLKGIQIIDRANKKGYIYFDSLPYSKFNLIFYKNYGVDDSVWQSIDYDDLVTVNICE